MIKIVAALVGANLLAALFLGPLGAPASADGQDGYVNPNEMIFFYNSSGFGYGSGSDFAARKKNFAGYRFISKGAGKGQPVKNNSAAVYNNRNRFAWVYFNSFGYKNCWCGPRDLVSPRGATNLSVTKNDNASFRWLSF